MHIYSLHSPEQLQLFLSGGYFAANISTVMGSDYKLTRADYLNTRTLTENSTETYVQILDRKIMFRDVGGEELNRALYWSSAIRDSFCTTFVVPLTKYVNQASTMQPRKRKEEIPSQLRDIRHDLWMYLLGETEPTMILLLNKQDMFRKNLRVCPLHTSCEDFRSVLPRAEDESDEKYSERCEAEIIQFFQQTPASVTQSEQYIKAKHAKSAKLQSIFVTQANDERLFKSVKKSVRKSLVKLIQANFARHGLI
jgi:hypothetical protein